MFSKDEFKKHYKSIVSVKSVAFGGKNVYFNKHGLRHIFWKGTTPRSKKEVINRINCFRYVVEVLKTESEISDYRIYNEKIIPAYFWSITSKKRKVRVVVRKVGDSNMHFFSIVDI